MTDLEVKVGGDEKVAPELIKRRGRPPKSAALAAVGEPSDEAATAAELTVAEKAKVIDVADAAPTGLLTARIVNIGNMPLVFPDVGIYLEIEGSKVVTFSEPAKYQRFLADLAQLESLHGRKLISIAE